MRPVAHRLSFAEMVVPYRDPTPDHYRRTAFDIGEWGLGFMTTSLELGCDCLGEIAYLDAVLHDSRGEPYTIRNAICIHEEDDAVLWKHVDAQAGAEVRRARRLVVSFHVTVANYEYLVYWRLYQDGNIECEVRATGIMVTTHFAEGAQPPYGTLVDERTYAPFHQHFLVARLDLDVDGEANTGHADRVRGAADRPDNPHGLALVQRATRRCAPSTRATRTTTGTPSAPGRSSTERRDNGARHAGRLQARPGAALPAMLDPARPVLRRAQAIGHTLWVTPYDEDERWPCGEFVVQSAERPRAAGLDRAQDRSIEDTDVVLWYVFGIHHITRPEEWPVMAGGHRLVLAQAGRLLRPQPGARRAADPTATATRGGPMRRPRSPTSSTASAWPRPTGRTTELIDPSTGEVFATAPLSREADVDAAFQVRARARSRGGATRRRASASAPCCGSPTRSRSAPSELCRGRVAEHRQAARADRGGGGPADVRSDPLLRGRARVLEGKSAGEYMEGYTSFIRREPVGVCAAVTPWNYPAMMAVWKWAPALAAGNTMVLKPSDTTPASTVWMAELMAEFLPPGVFNVVCGDRDTGAALVSHPIPAMVSITGSVGAGIAVAKARPTTSSACTSSSAARRR